MAEDMKRVEIGFGGGQVMSARLEGRHLETLRGSLASATEPAGNAPRWYELESEDGTISLDLRQVVFVRVAGAPQTIGFSGT
jgi:hypothetical protein